MADRDEILGFCDDLLDFGAFDDYGPNGLQVPGRTEVNKVATGVSANLELLERAVDSGAELVITHHGLLWGDRALRLSVPMAARLRALLCADVSLAALPPASRRPSRDRQQRAAAGRTRSGCGRAALRRGEGIGRRASIGRACGAGRRRRAERGGWPRPSARSRWSSTPAPSGSPASASSPAAGGFALHEAGPLGLDALITGEPSEPVMGEAREYGVHFLAGGHYATETFGIRRLGRAGRRALLDRARVRRRAEPGLRLLDPNPR